MIISAIITLFYVEPEIIIEGEVKKEVKYIKQIKTSFSYVFSNKKIMIILFFSAIYYFFSMVGFNYYQPYMQTIKIPEFMFGAVFFIFNFVAAFASKRVELFLKITKNKSLMTLCMLIAFSFIFISITPVWIGIIFIFLQQLGRGLNRPLLQKYINKNIPSDKRATIISIQGSVNSLTLALFAPLIGMLLDNSNIYTSHIVLGVLMIILSILANKLMSNYNNIREEIRKIS